MDTQHGKEPLLDGSSRTAREGIPALADSAVAPLLDNDDSQGYVTYASRYWVLTLFSACSALSAVMWIALAPIETIASAAFEVSSSAINTISLLFLLLYLPASILCMILVERYGTRPTLTIGAACNAIGTTLKYIGTLCLDRPPLAFGLVVTGQVFGGLGQPLILNIPARISQDWFGIKQRELATVTATMANILGQMIGSLLPPYIVNEASDMQWLMLGQAIPCILVAALCYFALPERPATPPSRSAKEQWDLRDHQVGGKAPLLASLQGMWQDVTKLCRDRNFIFLMLGFSIATGMSWTLLTVQAQVIQPCNYNDEVAGGSGAALLGVGIVVSFAVGPVLEKTKAYVLAQKLDMWISVGAAIFALAVNKPGNAGLVIGAWCVLGGALMPLLPITLEAAAEMTHPIPADTSTSVLLIVANLIGTALTYILGPLLNLPVSANCTSVYTPFAAVVLGFMVVGAVMVVPVKSVYRRRAADMQVNSIQ